MPAPVSPGAAAPTAGNPKPPTQFVTGAYEVLPPAIRAKIEASAFNWNTAAILDDLRHGVSERDVLAKIEAFEFAHAVMQGCPRVV